MSDEFSKDDPFIGSEHEERALVINSHNPIVIANSLIRSGHETMTIAEAKLLRLALSNVKKDDKEFYTYTCSASELAVMLNVDPKHIYSVIDKVTTDLFKKVIRIPLNKVDKNGNPSYKKINWLQQCTYDEGKLSITLSEQLKPYVLGLHSMFTMYLTESALSLSFTNSLRLYELIMSYNNINRNEFSMSDISANMNLEDDQLQFTIDYLRMVFDCDQPGPDGKIKYPNNSDFVRRVIDPSVKDINEKLRIVGPVLKYDLIRSKGRGGRIDAVKFTYIKRPVKSDFRSPSDQKQAHEKLKKEKAEKKKSDTSEQ